MIKNYTTFKNTLKLKLFVVVAAWKIVALGKKALCRNDDGACHQSAKCPQLSSCQKCPTTNVKNIKEIFMCASCERVGRYLAILDPSYHRVR